MNRRWWRRAGDPRNDEFYELVENTAEALTWAALLLLLVLVLAFLLLW